MPGKIKLKYLLVFSCIIIQHTYAQDNFTDAIQQNFNQYNQQVYTEKIYLNTDRNFYIAGEIMWFKLYITTGATNALSNLSKIVYTELIDENNRVFLQAKIGTNDGTGSGSFFIPANLPTGNYKIRCYTNWMKNFDASYFFETPVTIVNTSASAGLPVPDTSASYDIQFYPEGGNLVSSAENNIAFKITDKRNIGENNCKGFITEGNDTIAYFTPLHAGIGAFLFTPAPNRTYTAHIINASGKEITQKKLSVNIEGFAMRLAKQSNGQLTVSVKSPASNNANNTTLYLFAHTRGIIKSVQKTILQSGVAQFNIEENNLGEGITHFTVFNSQRQPVCERLYFKRPAQSLHIEISPEAQQYATRKKATLNVRTTNNSSQPVRANMSLSIFRMDDLQQHSTADFFSYLWLSADLAGYIENPAYYFTGNTDTTTQALDNLMLTHGWRRFKWENIQQSQKPLFKFLPEIEGQVITGKITDTFTRKPFADALVYTSVPGLYTQFYSSLSDKEGNIRFYTKNIVGPGELIVQAQDFNDRSYNIEINTPYSSNFSNKKFSYQNLTPGIKPALETNSINAQVQRKFAAEQLKKYYIPDIDTSTFYGKADERYMLDDFTRFTTMEEVLREYIPGVIVGRSNRKFKLTVFDVQNKRLFRDNPLLLLDGVPVQDADRIMKYDPLKIRKIEVVTRRYYFGPMVSDGIVNFVSYKGNMEEFEMDPKSVILDFDGMQLQREFYMPVYDTEEQQKSHLADFRNLLYWQPYVITAPNGETQVQFYTSDLKGKYIGVIEGITPNGVAGKSTYTFEIQ